MFLLIRHIRYKLNIISFQIHIHISRYKQRKIQFRYCNFILQLAAIDWLLMMNLNLYYLLAKSKYHHLAIPIHTLLAYDPSLLAQNETAIHTTLTATQFQQECRKFKNKYVPTSWRLCFTSGSRSLVPWAKYPPALHLPVYFSLVLTHIFWLTQKELLLSRLHKQTSTKRREKIQK